MQNQLQMRTGSQTHDLVKYRKGKINCRSVKILLFCTVFILLASKRSDYTKKRGFFIVPYKKLYLHLLVFISKIVLSARPWRPGGAKLGSSAETTSIVVYAGKGCQIKLGIQHEWPDGCLGTMAPISGIQTFQCLKSRKTNLS